MSDFINNEKNFELPVVLTMMQEMIEQVKYLHDNGIIHRDLKPDNFLLKKAQSNTGQSSRMQITDFGLSEAEAKILDQNAKIGTPFYIAPDNKSFTKCSLKKSDIWSLGMTFLDWLVQKDPWWDTSRALRSKFLSGDLMQADRLCNLLNSRILQLKKNNQSDPYYKSKEALYNLIMKMLKIDPEARCTIDECYEEIKKIKCLSE